MPGASPRAMQLMLCAAILELKTVVALKRSSKAFRGIYELSTDTSTYRRAGTSKISSCGLVSDTMRSP